MSVFNEAHAVCGACGTDNIVSYAASLNADRRPDLRAAILDGSFQAVKCEKCAAALRLPAHMSYLDVGRGQWTLVESYAEIPNWRETEAEARATYDLNFGPDADEAAREIGAELKPRLVFGWPALREKIVCADLSLRDDLLELLKMSIVANVAGSPVADETELRLVGGGDKTLDFLWLESATEKFISGLQVPRVAYDEIEDDIDDWASMLTSLDGNLYVDMKRLVSG